MTSKKKNTLYIKLIILILCLLIIVRIFSLVLSKYETEANSSADVDIAFYLFNEDYKTMTLNLATPLDGAWRLNTGLEKIAFEYLKVNEGCNAISNGSFNS